MIVIYQDYIHNNGHLWRALTKRFGVEQVILADANDLNHGVLNLAVKAFFMPGGATRYWAAQLGEEGNDIIRAYVAKGGTYVGICAGAYYGAEKIEWQKGTADEIIADHSLGFFDGTAHGPIAAFQTPHDTHTTITKLQDNKGEIYSCLYWGGPELIANPDSTHHVLAHYVAAPHIPAVIQGTYGQGRYFLISPHIEVPSDKISLMQCDVVQNRMAEFLPLQPPFDLDQGYLLHFLRSVL